MDRINIRKIQLISIMAKVDVFVIELREVNLSKSTKKVVYNEAIFRFM